jgi:putative tryptophan/tyrosine transport system substrate-binding protein
VDVIVAQGPLVFGAQDGAGALPMVFVFSGDPVEAKLVTSLARLGGTLTGVTLLALELAEKRLALLKEVRPGLSRVAILANPVHPGEPAELQASQTAAQQLGLTLQYVPVRAVSDFPAAFEAIARERAEALLAFPDALIMLQRHVIAEFAAQHRMPAVSGWADFAVAGNLMTYGPNLPAMFRRVAYYVDRILTGTKPADLPIEQPMTFELVINLKAAQALGLTIPPVLLFQADEVIR